MFTNVQNIQLFKYVTHLHKSYEDVTNVHKCIQMITNVQQHSTNFGKNFPFVLVKEFSHI